ncbi:MAG: helix-turn-helix transcriptional regulator [Vitreimonas sp.]
MVDFQAETLLETSTVTVQDVVRPARAPHASAMPDGARLVFPYRGAFVHEAGEEEIVADANQVLLLNAEEPYRQSRPSDDGDASLVLIIEKSLLREMAPSDSTPDGRLYFAHRRRRIDPRAQALVALLRHSLRTSTAEPLEAESLALTLAQRALGARTSHAGADATFAQRRLVDRTKLVIASDLARRWTLGEIAAEVGGSPVYLTQVFRQVEGVPLYRYQTRLRLARALDLIAQYEDLSALSFDLGFSSHSHFTAAFKQAYARTPTEFRRSALGRK